VAELLRLRQQDAQRAKRARVALVLDRRERLEQQLLVVHAEQHVLERRTPALIASTRELVPELRAPLRILLRFDRRGVDRRRLLLARRRRELCALDDLLVDVVEIEEQRQVEALRAVRQDQRVTRRDAIALQVLVVEDRLERDVLAARDL